MGGSANTGKRARSPDHFGVTAVRSQVPVLDSQEPLRNLSQKLLVKGVAGFTRPFLDSCTCLPRSSVCVCVCVCVYFDLTFREGLDMRTCWRIPLEGPGSSAT